MKKNKTFITILLFLIICLLSFCFACSNNELSQKEKFDFAKTSLNNYTADITITYSNGNIWYATLYVAGENGRIIYYSSSDSSSKTTKTYTITDGISIEDKFSAYNGDIGVFKKVLSTDFVQQDDWYICSEKGLEDLSKESIGTIESGKIKFENNKYSYAVVGMSFFGNRGEVSYHFYDYGKTKVEI